MLLGVGERAQWAGVRALHTLQVSGIRWSIGSTP